MNDYEMLKLFENMRKQKRSVLSLPKEDSQYLKMIAELLIDIKYKEIVMTKEEFDQLQIVDKVAHPFGGFGKVVRKDSAKSFVTD